MYGCKSLSGAVAPFALLAALGAALVALGHVPAGAETARLDTGCLGRSDVLGLARIVEIDTTDGPRFGEQYEENVFLEDGEVVLTFDDGPLRRFTEPILNTLDRHCVKATFFAVGRMAAADPEMLREVHRRGHTIGSHTWSHQKLGRVGAATGEREFELGLSTLQAALGKPVAPFFRFPYLSDPAHIQAYLRKRGHGIFGIDVDSRDFSTGSGERMKQRVLAHLQKKGKGIVLFHDIQRSTVAGLDPLLRALREQKYKIVHMVAKNDAKTIADYDKDAARRIRRKAAEKNANALADRAVTWPASSGTGAASDDDDLPWQKKSQRAAPSEPAGTLLNDRWQISPFGR